MSTGGKARGRARGRGRGNGVNQQQAPPIGGGNRAPTRADEARRPPTRPPTDGRPQSGPPQNGGRGEPPVAQMSQMSIRGIGRGQPREEGAVGGRTMGDRTQHREEGAVGGRTMGGVPIGATAYPERSQMVERGRRRGVDLYRPINVKPRGMTVTSSQEQATEQLLANHAYIRLPEIGVLYQYHVEFNPDVEQKSARTRLFRTLERDYIGTNYIFNGMMMYHRAKLPNEEFTVAVDNPAMASLPEDQRVVHITVKFTNELPFTSPEFQHLANVILRRIFLNMGLSEVQRNMYDMRNPITEIPDYKLNVYGGYEASILNFDAGLQLQIDISHKLLHRDTCYDIMMDLYDSRGPGSFPDKCYKKFIGQVVLTQYNNRSYRIDDIDFKTTPRATFETKSGPRTYLEYFKTQYNITNMDPEQPMFIVKPSERRDKRLADQKIYLPPSVCSLTGLSDDMKSDFRVMKAVGERTRVRPEQRRQHLTKFLQNLATNEQATTQMSRFDMDVQPNLVRVMGKRITDVRILVANNRQVPFNRQDAADFSRGMQGAPILSPVVLRNWVIVYPRREATMTHNAINTMLRLMDNVGVHMEEPIHIELAQDRERDYVDAIRYQYEQSNGELEMVYIVLSNSSPSKYSAIKKQCCIETPVMSQVVRRQTLDDRNSGKFMSCMTKIGLQMQSKLNGELWRVQMPQFAPTMIVGMDTFHDGANRSNSWAAAVASVNSNFTKYYSDVAEQPRKEEIHIHFRLHMNNALRVYMDENGHPPKYIIVFRDGVGDGFLERVQAEEIGQLEACLQQQEIQAKILFIVVKKRINTRFFLRVQSNPDRFDNPRPGTVVDTVCTRPDWYDFFLVPQTVNQGTVTPTHYNVIRDDIGWSVKNVQKLTYYMCHLYSNWQGTIRVPAPCQYAHRLAKLCGDHLHKQPHPAVKRHLFYI